MSSSSSSSSVRTYIAAGVGCLALGVSAYAVYFDYKRRNDPAFRAKLQKEHAKARRVAERSRSAQPNSEQELKKALESIRAEKLPTAAEECEKFFLEQVALGESLAKRGSEEFYLASAVCFFKAMKVYPAPQEIAMIYQQTQPPQVFELVMQLLKLETISAMSQQQQARSASGPVLEEVDNTGETASSQGSSAYVKVDAEAPANPVEAKIEEKDQVDKEVGQALDAMLDQQGAPDPNVDTAKQDPPEVAA